MAQHGHEQHAANEEHHDGGHVVPGRVLFLNGIALLILTWITVEAAYVDFDRGGWGDLDIWIALGIATVKASLVALFFMHLWWDRPFNGFIFVASVAFVALFIGLALTDVLSYAPDLLPGDAVRVREALESP